MNSPNTEIDDSYVLKRADIVSQSSYTWETFYSRTRVCTFPPGDCMPEIVIVKEKDLVPQEQLQEYISIADLKYEYAQNNLELIVEHNDNSNIYFYKFQNKRDSSNDFVIQFKTN
ncbi:hypothetical protein [Myroides guanonis]|uniref:Uncharacterized protein n=1 Tax=Myroides guanonis TaxID=1150112 RepID=A0A1I3PEN5_9FLAO|nr:hypothetical protein [Myroides guanonis]SFJ20104.1 hypothetical protein SAMN04487893_104100 [Myroides guanonis]